MRRCEHQMVFDVLEDAKYRRRSPTRLAAGCGVNYFLLQSMIEVGLLRKLQIQRRKRVVKTVAVPTEKGLRFMEHFKTLSEMMPEEDKH